DSPARRRREDPDRREAGQVDLHAPLHGSPRLRPRAPAQVLSPLPAARRTGDAGVRVQHVPSRCRDGPRHRTRADPAPSEEPARPARMSWPRALLASALFPACLVGNLVLAWAAVAMGMPPAIAMLAGLPAATVCFIAERVQPHAR